MRTEPSRRDRWKTRVLKTNSLTHGTKLFLVHTLAKHMKADGFVSQPRDRLAAEHGISPRQAARYIGNATTNGWLVLIAGGYVSKTAEYQATFPNPQSVTQHDTLSEAQEGDAFKHPLRGTNASPFTEGKGDASRHTTSSSTTRPLRIVGGTNRTQQQNPTRRGLSRRCVVRLGLGMNESDDTARTIHRTQPQPVERHRTHGLVAAPVERHASGTDPATRFGFCPTRPRRKALAMNEAQPRPFCCPVTKLAPTTPGATLTDVRDQLRRAL